MKVMTRRRLIAGAAVLGAIAPRLALAEPPGLRSVRMTTGLRATVQSITWIGTEAGIFRKHGLEVSFPKLEVGGPPSAAGLMKGEWDFAQTGTVPIAENVLNGGDAVILLRNHDPHPGIFVMTKPEITGLDQLNGKKVGVLTDAYSGQTGIRTRLPIEQAGATAIYVGLGTYRNIYKALAAGEIDAGGLPVDYRFAGQREHGWKAFEAGFDAPSIFATTRRLIASDRETVLRAVRGFIETIHVFKTRPDVVVPLLQRFLDIDDRKAVEEIRAFYVPLFPEVPRPDLVGGMQQIRSVFIQRYPAAEKLAESDIADSSIIDEVERSGFVDLLYGRGRAQ